MNSDRYVEDGKEVWVDDPSRGRVKAVHRGVTIWTNYPYQQYIVQLGDTIENLGFRMYNEPRRYWFISDMNPTVVSPDDLVPGDRIYLPLNLV